MKNEIYYHGRHETCASLVAPSIACPQPGRLEWRPLKCPAEPPVPFMRIHLQLPPVGSEPPHYYQLALEQDLLGGWILYHERGLQGARCSRKREQFLHASDALAAFEKQRDAQLKRGFRLMLSEGHPAAH